VIHLVLIIFALFASSRVFADSKATPSEHLEKSAETKTQSNQKQQKDASIDSPDDKPKSKLAKQAEKESPSFQQKRWTGTKGTSETNIQYDYVGNADQNLGNGHNAGVDEQYLDFRHLFMRHTLLAFLVQGGLEFQHQGFGAPNNALVPQRLDSMVGIVGLDFRWSEKDLLHVEGRPGFYSDIEGSGWDALNSPLDVGYTHVVNNKFQWVIGFSLNTWRRSRYLGGAGLRWQINDRWKIKAYMPTPAVEYLARPNLTLTMGADIRGDAYRVGPQFGNNRGRPALNNALVEYQEVRVGPGFSWNVKPTIEVNFMAGYMAGRSFDFFADGPKLNGSGAPFVSLAVHALFKLPGESLQIPQRSRVSIRNIFKYF